MAEKLTEIFNLRISPSLKQMVDQISNDEKKELNKRILDEMRIQRGRKGKRLVIERGKV